MKFYLKAMERTYEILEKGDNRDLTSKICDYILIVLVIINVFCIILESVDSIYKLYKEVFSYIEMISVIIFTIEYFLRCWSIKVEINYNDAIKKRTRLTYATSFYGLIDIVSILPFYLQFIFPGLDLRILRSIRLLRILKISHYSTAIEDLISAIYHERKAFVATLYLLSIAVLLSSTLFYFAETKYQDEKLSSIPDAIYWSLITLTTVGYGDITPITFTGKIITLFTSIMGVCIVALLAGIVATAFGNQISERKMLFEQEIRQALKDGFISQEEEQIIADMRENFNITEEQEKYIIEMFKSGKISDKLD